MEHNNHLSQNPLEIQFNDYIQRGDDFSKIEIFRLAKIWYNRALDLHVNDEIVKPKIQHCNEELIFERKTILTLSLIAVVIVGIIIVSKCI